MFKKIGAAVCTILVLATLTSCGEYSKLYETLDAMAMQTEFPQAVSDATTLSEAKSAVIEQQKALCEAMTEAYNLTDIESLREEHQNINRNKMMSELSNKRRDLNAESTNLFAENMIIILENIDKEDKGEYIADYAEEVKEFYKDYDKLTHSDPEDDYETVSKIFVSYAFSDNVFAKSIISENYETVVEATTRTIEANANKEGSFRANITKNNELIRAINEVMGGVGEKESYKDRINKANRKLLEKTLSSMSSMSQAERDAILNQFEEA